MRGRKRSGIMFRPLFPVRASSWNGPEWAGDQGSDPITRTALEEQFPDKIRLLDQVEENLYTCLSSFTDGEAWSIASNTPEGHGLEAYRRLCFRFDPSTAGRRRNIVSSLLNPEKVKLDDLGTAIETWEEKIRAYEQRRGPDGERKEMDDDKACVLKLSKLTLA